MVTYGGNRPTVNDNEILTAQAFNDATRFWVTDELPDTGKDGDVVFVVGDPVGGELPGIGGWATIESVTGNPTRYEYPAGNPEWVAFEWTDPATEDITTHDVTIPSGSITLGKGFVDALLVGGGGGGGGGGPNGNDYGRWSGGAGGMIRQFVYDPRGATHIIAVGKHGTTATNNGGNRGFASRIGTLLVALHGGEGVNTSWGASTCVSRFADGQGHPGPGNGNANNGAGGAGGPGVGGDGGPGRTDDITGTEIMYARGGGNNFTTPVANRGDGGKGSYGGGTSGRGTDGSDGVVIVRVPLANDNTKGQGSTPASVVAAVDQAKETVKQTIKRNRRNK